MKITSTRVVKTSFWVDCSDFVLNLVIALLTGSMVMLAEAMQGAADLITSGLLYVGIQRSRRRTTREYSFGYGRELYFWTLMSGVMMLVLTATLSFYLGWQRFFNPAPITDLPLAILMLFFGVTTNGYALTLSWQRLRAQKPETPFWKTFVLSDLVETKAAFILDLMGTASATSGLVALTLFQVTGDLHFDGLGAMIIGTVIAILAVVLVGEVKDLLVGRSASPEVEEDISRAALSISGVKKILDLRTMYIGSERLLVNMEVKVAHRFTTVAIEHLMDKIKAAVKAAVPSVHHIQVELETPSQKSGR